jgi:outer membrane biosynthesis protein TonB
VEVEYMTRFARPLLVIALPLAALLLACGDDEEPAAPAASATAASTSTPAATASPAPTTEPTVAPTPEPTPEPTQALPPPVATEAPPPPPVVTQAPPPSPPPPPSAPLSASVAMLNLAFTSNPTIAAGGSVTWTNQDGEAHNVVASDGSFISPLIDPGTSYTRTFPSAGTFPYLCSLHAGMSGTVTVR